MTRRALETETQIAHRQWDDLRKASTELSDALRTFSDSLPDGVRAQYPSLAKYAADA